MRVCVACKEEKNEEDFRKSSVRRWLKCKACVAPQVRKWAARKGPEYSAWRDIKQRCNNPSNESYKDYGERGIKICSRWNDDFDAFLEDVGKRPSPEHTIERVDNDKGYFPGNVIWATQKEQSRNKRNSRKLIFRGEEKCLVEWAEIVGIKDVTIRSRLRNGWSIEEALTIPVGDHRSEEILKERARNRSTKYSIEGEKKSLVGWCEIFKISSKVVRYRLKEMGWPLEKALRIPKGEARPKRYKRRRT